MECDLYCTQLFLARSDSEVHEKNEGTPCDTYWVKLTCIELSPVQVSNVFLSISKGGSGKRIPFFLMVSPAQLQNSSSFRILSAVTKGSLSKDAVDDSENII